MTEDDILARRSPGGGWTREQLAEWGVAWPPKKGWKAELVARYARQSATGRHFGCPYCTKTFATADGRYSHAKAVHRQLRIGQLRPPREADEPSMAGLMIEAQNHDWIEDMLP